MDGVWQQLGHLGRATFVKRPEQRFPGICIQGDTAYLWLRDIAESIVSGSHGGEEQESLRLLAVEL